MASAIPPALMNPITGFNDCARDGNIAAAEPKSVMKSRRLTPAAQDKASLGNSGQKRT